MRLGMNGTPCARLNRTVLTAWGMRVLHTCKWLDWNKGGISLVTMSSNCGATVRGSRTRRYCSYQ